MKCQLAQLLLHCYPREWRVEYGSELKQLLCGRSFRMADVWNVLWSGFRERIRRPVGRFAFYTLVGSTLAFLTCQVFADSLWRVLSSPVTGVLRGEGHGLLIQVTPFEGLGVVRIGIPLLTTALATFAWALVLTWIFSAEIRGNHKRRWVRQFVLCSGAAFVLATLVSVMAWPNESLAKWLGLYRDIQHGPMLSLTHYFEWLALLTLGFTLLLQIPVWGFFVRRLRADRPLVDR